MTTSIPQASRTVTRKGVAFGLAAFVLSIGGCAPTAQLSQVPPTGVSASVAAPAISAGDSWTYQVRDGFTGLPRPEQRHEVIRVGGGRIEVAGNVERGDGRQVYDGEWNWLRRPATDLQTFEYQPAYQAYAFPLAPGKTWRSESVATDPRDGRRFPVKIEARVLDADSMGYWQTTGHTHCAFPASQRAALEAYVQKLLVGGGTGNTALLRGDAANADLARWKPWTTPSLQ